MGISQRLSQTARYHDLCLLINFLRLDKIGFNLLPFRPVSMRHLSSSSSSPVFSLLISVSLAKASSAFELA